MKLDTEIREHYNIAAALRGPDNSYDEHLLDRMKDVLTARLRGIVKVSDQAGAIVRHSPYLPDYCRGLRDQVRSLAPKLIPSQRNRYEHYLMHLWHAFDALLREPGFEEHRKEIVLLRAVITGLCALISGVPDGEDTLYTDWQALIAYGDDVSGE